MSAACGHSCPKVITPGHKLSWVSSGSPAPPCTALAICTPAPIPAGGKGPGGGQDPGALCIPEDSGRTQRGPLVESPDRSAQRPKQRKVDSHSNPCQPRPQACPAVNRQPLFLLGKTTGRQGLTQSRPCNSFSLTRSSWVPRETAFAKH